MTPSAPARTDAAVVAAIAPLVARTAARCRDVALVSRRPNACFSSSPSEIVTLDVDGEVRELFVKYDRVGLDEEPRCRHGLDYCWKVYERIVRHLPPPSVACLGRVEVGDAPVAALVLEHLAGALRVNEAADESGVLAAAEWCGRLHTWGTRMRDDPALAFLVRCDLDHYRAWTARARRLAAGVGPLPARVGRICDGFETQATALADAERTTIHGEFGPQNVLWRDGVVYPVDWESAAVGPGAVDLATLLFAWPADVVRRGVEAYWRSRRRPAPANFAATFAAATVYTALRWLPVPNGQDDPQWREGLARLEATADMAGIG